MKYVNIRLKQLNRMIGKLKYFKKALIYISEIESSKFRRGYELGERNGSMDKEKNKSHR